MPQQQAKPKGMPPMKKPEGTGSAAKPRILTAPSLAKPIGSQETDMAKAQPKNIDTMSPRVAFDVGAGKKKLPYPENIDNMSPRVAHMHGSLTPGTIKKAISYAVNREPRKIKSEKKKPGQADYLGVKPFWERPGFKAPKISKGGDDPEPYRFTPEEVADIDRERKKRLASESKEPKNPPGQSMRGLAYQGRMNTGRKWS